MSNLNPRNRHLRELRANNVVIESSRATQLKCGCATKAQPIVSSPARRYWCDEHGLQSARDR